MSAALFNRGPFADSTSLLASLHLASNACRLLAKRHAELGPVAATLADMRAAMASAAPASGTPSTADALRALRKLLPRAADGDRRELENVERVLCHIEDERRALADAACIEAVRP